MNEDWTAVAGAGRYEVSTRGRVRYTKDRRRVLKPFIPAGKPYPAVKLTMDDGTRRFFYLHILVAKTYIPNPLGLPEVNHTRGEHLNPSVDQLEWIDGKGNCQHKNRVIYAHHNAIEVTLVQRGTCEIRVVKNLTVFAEEIGADKGDLSRLINGKRRSVKGWEVHQHV